MEHHQSSSSTKDKSRELLLGIVGTKYTDAGTEQFLGLTLARLQRLIDLQFVSVLHNPDLRKMLEFASGVPQARFHGFAVAPWRSDSRVEIQGIHVEGEFDDNSILYFQKTFSDAPVVEANRRRLYCSYKKQ